MISAFQSLTKSSPKLTGFKQNPKTECPLQSSRCPIKNSKTPSLRCTKLSLPTQKIPARKQTLLLKRVWYMKLSWRLRSNISKMPCRLVPLTLTWMWSRPEYVSISKPYAAISRSQIPERRPSQNSLAIRHKTYFIRLAISYWHPGTTIVSTHSTVSQDDLRNFIILDLVSITVRLSWSMVIFWSLMTIPVSPSLWNSSQTWRMLSMEKSPQLWLT